MRNRRAALDGLGRILDAGAPEDLFDGDQEEGAFLYELLAETARARSSTYYWEICRTARRRGVTPEYVIDRAIVLLAAIKERRRTDLYRILGVPPLADGEVIRHRWLELAKRHHPDVGGDANRFRQAKQAYEVLRDADRRGEYERFWIRALGPFERVVPLAGPTLAPPEARPQPEMPAAPPPIVPEPPLAAASSSTAEPAPEPAVAAANGHAPEPASLPTDVLGGALAEVARLYARRAGLDRRIGAVADGGGPGLTALLARIEGALAPIPLEEIQELSADVAAAIARLEGLGEQLRGLAMLRRVLEPGRAPLRASS